MPTKHTATTLRHGDRRHHMHATPPSPPRGMRCQPHVERTLPPAHIGRHHPHHEDRSAIVPRASSEPPTPPDTGDAATPPPVPRDAPLPKRSPRLRVTDHHDADQPPTTVEDTTRAMPLAAGENDDHPLPHVPLTKRTTRSDHRRPSAAKWHLMSAQI
jgi:hypothetical protein